ncbi:Mariner transposase [Oopsacas minuta]|uniref:Mariner transposase n=1 Tax=Oopsacas minuta TaxID=111878 RepID=A0AAV7JH99_9METZ|nr:Mariner transposase [Oopsacas minuta]
MLQRFANGSSRAVSEILTGDEIWIYHYDPETKRMSKEWVEEDAPPPTKVQSARSVGNKCGRFFSGLVVLSKLLLSRIERLLLPTGILQCAYPKSSQQLSHSGRRQALEEFFFIMIMHHRIRQSELVSLWKILDSKHHLTHPTVLI